MTTVRDIMSKDLVTVERDSSVRDLARLLTEEEITGVPVVGTHGEVVGVVSATDILQLAASGESPPASVAESTRRDYYHFETEIMPDLSFDGAWMDWTTFEDRTVGEIMNPVRYSIGPEVPVTELANFLLDKRIHRALVLEDEELSGIVTTYDVLRDVAGRITPA